MTHRFHFAILFGFLALALIALSAGPVMAQAIDGAVPGNTTAAASADAELWRAVRGGESFTTSGHDPKAGLLIQSQGHLWQQFRDGPLAMATALILGGMVILLCLFYAIRGRIRIEAGPSPYTILRFTLIERTAHWVLAGSFILLALTGLNILFGRKVMLPWMGHEAFAVLTSLGKLVHNYVAFAFMLAIVAVAILWVVHNIPNRHDLVWLLKGGGLFGGGHPPAKKFNAGQKILFWMVILCGVSLSLSGWALLNPFTTTMMADTFAKVNAVAGTTLPTDLTLIEEQQLQATWHAVMAAVMMAIIIAHIYIGSVGMEGAIDAMTTGEVDLNWAHEHHHLWVEEVEQKEAGKIGAPGTPAE